MTFTKAEQLENSNIWPGHKETVESKKFLADVRSLRKLHRTIYWWLPRAVREIEFLDDGSTARNFRNSKIIAGS